MTSYVLCKTGSLAMFKVTARDQGHYKGPSGAFVTYCNISCLVRECLFRLNCMVLYHNKIQFDYKKEGYASVQTGLIAPDLSEK